jgi:peroxiredoxin Q/BCP
LSSNEAERSIQLFILKQLRTMEIGDRLPEVLGLDQDGKEIKLSDFAGRKLVLYIYPKDSTPGCTNEACNLRDNYERFLSKGYAVVGVSIQSAESHKKFIAKYNLPFPLIADTEKKLVEALGVYGEKKMYGKTTMGTFRTTFITDEQGVITQIFRPKQIKVKEHAEQILK